MLSWIGDVLYFFIDFYLRLTVKGYAKAKKEEVLEEIRRRLLEVPPIVTATGIIAFLYYIAYLRYVKDNQESYVARVKLVNLIL